MLETFDRPARILIADDELHIQEVLFDLLSDNYDCTTVASAEEALARLRAAEFDLVLSDISMSGMSGLEMIPHIGELWPDTVVVMISGAQNIESAIDAMRAGAFDYVTKPFDLRHVEAAVERAREHHELLIAKRRYENFLEDLVAQRTAELDGALKSLEEAYRMTLKALAAALEARDHETHGHSARVVAFSLRLGRELALAAADLRALEFGALLHDIGKIGVPDAVLHKPAQLSEEEWRRMRLHPVMGARILTGIDFLAGAARVVAQHHERWDGSGYPCGLRGAEIDLGARIFAVADAFDAITSERVYRAGRSYAAALKELNDHAGRQFDPQIVAAFQRIPLHEWDDLRCQSLQQWQVQRTAVSNEFSASLKLNSKNVGAFIG